MAHLPIFSDIAGGDEMNKIDLLRQTASDNDGKIVRVIDRLTVTMDAIRKEYLRRHIDPWVVAYSGGKDSTLLLQLTWEVVASLPPCDRRRKVYVVGNDTLVESPLVIQHLKKTMTTISNAAVTKGLPIEVQITRPHVDQTFWVNVIGRGYIPPTRNFRWCTDRMKIIPTNQLLEGLVRRYKRAVLLVGTRKSESVNRRRNMEKHGVSGTTMNPHSSIKGCRMFAPLAEFEDEDVWLILMQRKPPWGSSHRDLITLYRNAGGGECPLVLTKDDVPSCGTSSPRFGCWTCTVVNKDRSLRGIIDSGHEEAEIFELFFDFREWLIQLREDNTNRQHVRRDGNTKSRADGTPVMGPFTLTVRQKILQRLEALEQETGQQLISESEIEVIKDIWRRDKVQEEGRLALHAALVPDASGAVI